MSGGSVHPGGLNSLERSVLEVNGEQIESKIKPHGREEREENRIIIKGSNHGMFIL